MTFLQLSGIQKHFAGVVAVENFDLEAAKGEFVSFLGPSGCGKTTTLRMIAGFERPTAGTIQVDGNDITDAPPNKRNVGMVFQSYALFPNMNVAENIGFGLKIRGRPADAIRTRVGELLELIHLEGRGGRYPYQLSGGQQQRVALARALAIEPTVLLLDEPLSALDAKIRVALRHEIRDIQRQLGITTVYVTHDQEEALELSDRIVVMSDGRVEQIGTPFEIYNFPATAFVASFVGTLNALPGSIVDAAAGRLTLGGHEVRTSSTITGASGSEVMVAIRPEMIALEGPDAPASNGRNRLPATVDDVAFLGSVVRFRVKLGDDAMRLNVDTFNNPNLAVPGPGRPRDHHVPAGSLPRPRSRFRAHPGRRARRRGGPAVAGARPTSPDLTGIDVVILDKDGTLVDFHAMWGGWARELGQRLEASGPPSRGARRLRGDRLRPLERARRARRCAGRRDDGPDRVDRRDRPAPMVSERGRRPTCHRGRLVRPRPGRGDPGRGCPPRRREGCATRASGSPSPRPTTATRPTPRCAPSGSATRSRRWSAATTALPSSRRRTPCSRSVTPCRPSPAAAPSSATPRRMSRWPGRRGAGLVVGVLTGVGGSGDLVDADLIIDSIDGLLP